MNFAHIKLDIFYALIILMVTGFLYSVLPDRHLTPHGLLLPLQNTMPSPPQHNIPVLTAYPTFYKPLGNISITMAFHNNNELTLSSNMEQCKNKAKTLAEEAGADAVVILRAGHFNKGLGLNSTFLYAQAILTH